MAKNDLTYKQQRFCEEYILDWNATRAAIAAGYSEKTARSIACENLTKPYIKAYIDECKNNIEQLAGVSKLRAVKEWAKLAFSNVTDIFDIVDGRVVLRDGLTKLSDLPRETTDILSELQENPAGGVKMKSYCKDNALKQLSDLLGWSSPQKIESTNINIDAEPTDEQKQEAIERVSKGKNEFKDYE